MTTTAEISVAVVTNNGTRDVITFPVSTSVTLVAGLQDGQMTPLTLASGFNALTVPTGAQGVMIRLTAGALTITVKGVTGDTGVVLQSGTLTTVPIILPLGTSPSIGLTTSGTGGTCEVLFF